MAMLQVGVHGGPGQYAAPPAKTDLGQGRARAAPQKAYAEGRKKNPNIVNTHPATVKPRIFAMLVQLHCNNSHL